MDKLTIQFLNDPTRNPLTNRPIKKDGNTYKQLMFLLLDKSECTPEDLLSTLKSTEKITRSRLEVFRKDQSRNPWTNRKITDGGPTHKRLCALLNSVDRLSSSDENTKSSAPVITYRNRKIPVAKQVGEFTLSNVELGSGGFGSVFCCTDTLSKNKHFAVKVEYATMGGLGRENRFYSKYLGIRFLPETFGYHKIGSLRYLVMEKLTPYVFSLNNISSVIDILQWLSIQRISHCDIKMSNIMQRENGEIVLIDFGLHCKINPVTVVETNNITGTYLFMSRNAHKGLYSALNDIESLGYALYDHVCNRLPWETYSSKDRTSIYNSKILFLEELSIDFRTPETEYITRYLLLVNACQPSFVDYDAFLQLENQISK